LQVQFLPRLPLSLFGSSEINRLLPRPKLLSAELHSQGASRRRRLKDSSAEPLSGARFRFGRFLFAIPRRGMGLERTEKARRDVGYFIDSSQERRLICIRRFVKTADLSYKLERSGLNLFGGDGRIEIEKGFDIPAHLQLPRVLRIAKG
jgi:hypothetical protein